MITFWQGFKSLWTASDYRWLKRLKKSNPTAYKQAEDYIGDQRVSEFQKLIVVQCFIQFNQSPEQLDPEHKKSLEDWAIIAYHLKK